MKDWPEFLLCLCTQIDEKVSAAEQIQPRERRIAQNVLRCKDDHIPDLFTYAVKFVLFCKEPLQPLQRHICDDVGRVSTLASEVNGVFVYVCCIDLDLEINSGQQVIQALSDNDGDGICLLASGAADHPDADGFSSFFGL